MEDPSAALACSAEASSEPAKIHVIPPCMDALQIKIEQNRFNQANTPYDSIAHTCARTLPQQIVWLGPSFAQVTAPRLNPYC